MAVCAEYRIPHSQFLSWPDDDRDKALWWHLRQRQTCPSCGTRAAEWDPEQGGSIHAYVAQVDVCRGCQQIESRKAALTGDESRGVQIVLARPRPPEPDAETVPAAGEEVPAHGDQERRGRVHR